MKKIEKIFNAETGDETIVERDETPTEKLEREQDEIAAAERLAEAEKRAIAKSELLAKLGITAEEAKLLLS